MTTDPDGVQLPFYWWWRYSQWAMHHGHAHPGTQAALGRYWAATVREGRGGSAVPGRNTKGPAAIAWHRALTVPGYLNRTFRRKGPTLPG